MCPILDTDTGNDVLQALDVEAEEKVKSAPLRKTRSAYPVCTDTGIIDDGREDHPLATCGSEWRTSVTGGAGDVQGPVSDAQAEQAYELDGRSSITFSGRVAANEGEIVALVMDLAKDEYTVDARGWDGIELEVRCSEAETYCVSLVESRDTRVKSFRAPFPTKPAYGTVRVAFEDFVGQGEGAKDGRLDISKLRRIGVLAVDNEGVGREFELSILSVQFYCDMA